MESLFNWLPSKGLEEMFGSKTYEAKASNISRPYIFEFCSMFPYSYWSQAPMLWSASPGWPPARCNQLYVRTYLGLTKKWRWNDSVECSWHGDQCLFSRVWLSLGQCLWSVQKSLFGSTFPPPWSNQRVHLNGVPSTLGIGDPVEDSSSHWSPRLVWKFPWFFVLIIRDIWASGPNPFAVSLISVCSTCQVFAAKRSRPLRYTRFCLQIVAVQAQLSNQESIFLKHSITSLAYCCSLTPWDSVNLFPRLANSPGGMALPQNKHHVTTSTFDILRSHRYCFNLLHIPSFCCTQIFKTTTSCTIHCSNYWQEPSKTNTESPQRLTFPQAKIHWSFSACHEIQNGVDRMGRVWPMKLSLSSVS